MMTARRLLRPGLLPFHRQVQHLGLSNALVLSRDSTVVGKVKALGMKALLIKTKVGRLGRAAADI
jgi:hypothetical protein